MVTSGDSNWLTASLVGITQSYVKNKGTTLHMTPVKEGKIVVKHGHLKVSDAALKIVNGYCFKSCDTFWCLDIKMIDADMLI